ncbi:hypothetical protein N7517_011275 [Penicillium concentricum]|uniref:Uncharacterized protein n=1 Tax=Penicillium concentricum TaxID=293559 RepID=A0A9W9UVW0_9EURO|nr:uncharacterized protein N7517_011275 [Penicillium concentricum]KAJ5356666.1 hypothetical protein N7517_011275 [Penicillium concentricum]
MILKGLGPRSLPNRTLSSQLHVTCGRSLATTLFRPSKAQDSQGCQNSESKQEEINQTSKNPSNQDNKRHALQPKAKTVSQADAELRERLEQMSGEGGASGIEYEDGKANAMKRGVRNNMFRLI